MACTLAALTVQPELTLALLWCADFSGVTAPRLRPDDHGRTGRTGEAGRGA